MRKRIFGAIVIAVLLATVISLGVASIASEEPTAEIRYHTLSYKSNVSIKYAVEATGLSEDAVIEDVVGVTVTKNGVNYEADYEGQTLIGNKEYSVFGFSGLSASEMTVDVYATPYVKALEMDFIRRATE